MVKLKTSDFPAEVICCKSCKSFQNPFPVSSFRLQLTAESVVGNLLSAAAAEAFLEEFLELCVEHGVNYGVESTVDVAQPGDSAH